MTVLLMKLKDIGFKAVDIFPKAIFRLKILIFGIKVFTRSEKSDSDSTPYAKYIEKTLVRPRHFRKFRKNYSYRVILEHVDYDLGRKYLSFLNSNTLNAYKENKVLSELSFIGSPRTYKFEKIGKCSPTVLRYLFVNQHLTEIFGASRFQNVAEVGVGFGGQFVVSSALMDIESYSIYDLPVVTKLLDKVLNGIGLTQDHLNFKSIDPLFSQEYDLVLSNYAFSELPYSVQLDDVNKVLSSAKRGYLTMNSGRTNLSGRSTGKMSLDELLELIPGSEVLEEEPLTGPDNYILIWGHNKG